MSQDIFVLIEHQQGQVADISYVMLAAARELSQVLGGKVSALLFGHQAQKLADNLNADELLYIDHPALKDFTSEAYQLTLTGLITSRQPRLVLFGSTTVGSDVAGGLSIKMKLPLASSCHHFTSDGKYVSQICGGKILTEGNLAEPIALLTMVPGGYKTERGQAATPPALVSIDPPVLEGLRSSVLRFIQPEAGDVDIAKEPILISVGRGIQTQDNLELAENLANALGGVVCASRPVIDQGWLPASRLVGKSGKYVKPKVYFAMGISGAPEHAEAIMGSGKIIAVNTDPTAPIFNFANFGTETDLFDLVDVLVEKINASKGG